MRILGLVFGVILIGGCSGDDTDPLPMTPDAGLTPADAGVLPLTCANVVCNAVSEYCRIDQVAECMAVDGGACGMNEEACTLAIGGSGCFPSPNRSCAPLDTCTSCVCLLANDVCGNGAGSCLGREGGFEVVCPP